MSTPRMVLFVKRRSIFLLAGLGFYKDVGSPVYEHFMEREAFNKTKGKIVILPRAGEK